MLVERSYLIFREWLAQRFVATMVEYGSFLLKALNYATAVSFGRGVERPDSFMLLYRVAGHGRALRLHEIARLC